MIVGCIYRPPWVDVCSFNVLLDNMFDSLHKNNYVFLLGDFNVDISHDVETSVAMEEFKNIVCSHHLYPLINNPTREVKSSRTIIDNIYCNLKNCVPTNALNISNVGIIRTYISDHHAIFCLFNETKLQHYKQNLFMKRSLCERNIAQFSHNLKKETWDIVYEHRWRTRGFKALLIYSLTNVFKNGCLK